MAVFCEKVLEAKAVRAGLEREISDAAVMDALRDKCELWECAERWGVDEATAALRLKVYSKGL
jgi:hypothetical protein